MHKTRELLLSVVSVVRPTLSIAVATAAAGLLHPVAALSFIRRASLTRRIRAGKVVAKLPTTVLATRLVLDGPELTNWCSWMFRDAFDALESSPRAIAIETPSVFTLDTELTIELATSPLMALTVTIVVTLTTTFSTASRSCTPPSSMSASVTLTPLKSRMPVGFSLPVYD